jgi:hypothetical protein
MYYVDPAEYALARASSSGLIALMWSSEVDFEVRLGDGSITRGRATPEGASWDCPCGLRLDMASEAAHVVTGGLRLDCTACGRGYWLSRGLAMIGVFGVDQSPPGPRARP